MRNSDFIVSFATTFLGAFLALGLTYLYDSHKTSRLEAADRRKALTTIRHELQRNLAMIERHARDAESYKTLERRLNTTGVAGEGQLRALPDVRLERNALDAAEFSGKLFLLDQNTFEVVTENYRRIDVVNRSSDDLRAMARGPVTQAHLPAIAGLVAVVDGTVDNLRESIPQAIRTLEEKLAT